MCVGEKMLFYTRFRVLYILTIKCCYISFRFIIVCDRIFSCATDEFISSSISSIGVISSTNYYVISRTSTTKFRIGISPIGIVSFPLSITSSPEPSPQQKVSPWFSSSPPLLSIVSSPSTNYFIRSFRPFNPVCPSLLASIIITAATSASSYYRRRS